MTATPAANAVDLLILGAGWTSTFLIPLCAARGVSCAATSRAGGADTIAFVFDPAADDAAPYATLPAATSVLITFPITLPGAAARLVRLYRATHAGADPGFIQLGTTSIWDGTRNLAADKKVESKWHDRNAPYTRTERAQAEEELLALPDARSTVLNLAGLWGGARSMRNYVGRVAPTKDALRNKVPLYPQLAGVDWLRLRQGSIHMIHGLDVSRAVLAVHEQWAHAGGQRWLLTDGRVYDWWDLASAWGSAPAVDVSDRVADADEGRGPQARWVRELLLEEGVRGLPRDVELLGRALDSREFWLTFGLSPLKARLDRED